MLQRRGDLGDSLAIAGISTSLGLKYCDKPAGRVIKWLQQNTARVLLSLVFAYTDRARKAWDRQRRYTNRDGTSPNKSRSHTFAIVGTWAKNTSLYFPQTKGQSHNAVKPRV